MIVKVLGVLDILVGIIFAFEGIDKWGIIPNILVLIFGIALLVKAAMFIAFMDFASVVDVICALLIIVSFWIPVVAWLHAIVALFLIQKGIVSIAV